MSRPTTTRAAGAAVLLAVALASGTTGAVAAAKITSADIKDGTIATVDVSSTARAQLQVVGGYRAVRKFAGVQPGEISVVTATCRAGTHVLGAGAFFDDSVEPTSIYIAPNLRVVRGYGTNNTQQKDTLRLVVTCGRVSPTP